MMLSHGPGFFSNTSSEIQEKQADVVIRTTGYYRSDYGLSVIYVSPTEHSNVRQSLLTTCIQPAMSLGALDRLPMELLLQTLRSMDMQSIFKLRQVNARGRLIVDSLKEYKAVVSYGLTAYCALLRTQLAAYVTLIDFYQVLCTKHCQFCGKFGGFVFLPTWIRCCFECIEEDPETRMVTVAEVRRLFRLSRDELVQQRSFQTLPGIYTTGLYSMEKSCQKNRVKIVPYFPAMKMFGDRLDLPSHPNHQPFWDPIHNFMSSSELPYYDELTQQIEHGISCAGCELGSQQGILRMSDDPWDGKPWDNVFSRNNFLKHFRICTQAQALWNSSFIDALDSMSKSDTLNGRFLLRDRSATF